MRATLPKKGKSSSLASISGSSVIPISGQAVSGLDAKGGQHILLYHYNGTIGRWPRSRPPARVFPQGIIDLSPTSVYLVAALPVRQGGRVSLGRHSVVGRPDQRADRLDLPGFVGSSASDFYGLDSTDYDGVDHWNGASWSHVGTFNTDDNLSGLAEGTVGAIWSDGWFSSSSNEVYVAENGVRQTNPSSVMTQTGIMSGVASGSGTRDRRRWAGQGRFGAA